MGEQNMPSQTVSFDTQVILTENNQGQKIQKRNLTLGLTTWKYLDTGPVPWRELWPEIAAKIMGKVWWQNLGRA